MTSRDQERAASNLLRQSLRDADDGCPGPDILAAYLERSLDAQESPRYELHLTQCARCREQLALLDRVGTAVEVDGAHPPRSASWMWLWDWRRLAPAMAVLIVLAVWIARLPTPKQANEPTQLVAMSQPRDMPTTSAEAQPARNENMPGPTGVPKRTPALNLTNNLGSAEKPSSRGPTPRTSKEIQTDSLEGKNEEARNFAMGPSNRTPPSSVSRNASASPSAENSGLRETTASDRAALAPRPSVMEAKTQQASADAGVPSQIVALEATIRQSAGEFIATPDPKLLWRIAGGGSVERSEDGGVSWQRQFPDVGSQFTAGSAPSDTICWLVGRRGVIVLTTDAKDWKRIPPPTSADFVAIAAQGLSTATVTTADGRKFLTGDGGLHWSPAD
jgi:hypothetical protein